MRIRKSICLILKAIAVLTAVIVVSLSLVALFAGGVFRTMMNYAHGRFVIPSDGVWCCEELGAELFFGEECKLMLSDSSEYKLFFTRSGELLAYEPDDLSQVHARAQYKAYISRGYVELSFKEYPDYFQEGKSYRFYLKTNEAKNRVEEKE